MRNPNGFTLIELMIVILIIGILAAIAIPNLTRYRDKAYLSEGMLLADAIKKEIVQYYEVCGSFPDNNKAAGLPPPDQIKGKYVNGIKVDKGVIQITFRKDLFQKEKANNQNIISIRPTIIIKNPTGPIIWLKDKEKTVPGTKAI